jgi:3-phosphoshikimate 1-carboxyvinyltransferase
MVGEAGMKVDRWDNDFRIPAQQKMAEASITIEPDMSSAFSLAAAAAVEGSLTVVDFPTESMQPDFLFVDVLRKMGAAVSLEENRLKVQKAAGPLRGVAVRLTNAPDLFPVLAALCSLAEGESELYGAPQLVHKESNRIEKVAELLRWTGRKVTPLSDGLRISGEVHPIREGVSFNPDHDHRLAMAAAILKLAGLPIRIETPDVVNKSFSGFWRATGVSPE